MSLILCPLVLLAGLLLVFNYSGDTTDPFDYSTGAHFLKSAVNLYANDWDYCEGVFVAPQVVVGDYRADFLVKIVSQSRGRHFIVLECDGHDHHERTKQQAARDRRRDRWMITQGITVLRFTGSEIWADPIACASNVQTVVLKVDVP